MRSSPYLRWKVLIVLTLTLISCATVWASTQKVLYSFSGGMDGAWPEQSHTLAFDKAGNLYGTTAGGGVYGRGTVFKLAPTATGWRETVLYSFTGFSDGKEPRGGVVVDAAGNLYGATTYGGDDWCGCGIIFQLTPSESGWNLTVLHTFVGGWDGSFPVGGLILLEDNSLYGTAGFDGHFSRQCPAGCGIIFELWRSGSSWSYGVYNYFKGFDGRVPEATLFPIGTALYGTTFRGGSHGNGNVFYSWGPGRWGITNLHTFSARSAAGNHPDGAVVAEYPSAPNVYGTTLWGGKCPACGAVFELSWEWGNGTKPGLKVLHAFSGPDGDRPRGLIFGNAGSLYGITWGGGPGGRGTVFQLTPGAKDKWTHSLLHAFSGPDGAGPVGTLVMDAAGNLYGTTGSGGDYDMGVVFEIIP